MEGSEIRLPAVCDAGPVIHLDEMGSLDLLADFSPLTIPAAVQREIQKHRPQALIQGKVSFTGIEIIPQPGPRLVAISKAFALDRGELEALSILQNSPGVFFFTDDAAARLAGEELGCKVHGTIGLLLRAVRRKLRTPREVVALLEQIPTSTTLFLKPALLEDIIRQIMNEYDIKPPDI